MTGTTERAVGLAVALLALGAGPAGAQVPGLPPDTVSTLFRSDSISGFGAVGGIASDALGYLYVADFRNSVWRISPEGDVERFADGLYGASGNAVGPRGHLFQSSFHGNYVSRISRTGEVERWVEEGLSGPVGIAVDAAGNLFVCNCSAGTISKVGVDRVARTFAESELLACPNGITFDDRGDLYVVSFNSTIVVRITPDGEVSRFADIPGAGGNGHITFARGGFYVTKFRGNQVFRVGRDGAYRVVAGTGQPGELDGPALTATFTRPNGIAMDATGTTLWVNDLESGVGGGVGPSVVVLRRIRIVSLTDVLEAVPAAGGVQGLREAYDLYRRERPDDDSATEAGTLAFRWMSTGRVAEGVALHEWNATSYPDQVATQFNLGEAYRYTGQPARAAIQYERVLELEPDHAAAKARLDLVRGHRVSRR
jgi:sugar lactone lactonase YvrE